MMVHNRGGIKFRIPAAETLFSIANYYYFNFDDILKAQAFSILALARKLPVATT